MVSRGAGSDEVPAGGRDPSADLGAPWSFSLNTCSLFPSFKQPSSLLCKKIALRVVLKMLPSEVRGSRRMSLAGLEHRRRMPGPRVKGVTAQRESGPHQLGPRVSAGREGWRRTEEGSPSSRDSHMPVLRGQV